MGSRLPQSHQHTAVKFNNSLQQSDEQHASSSPCPYGSPISGLCTGSAAATPSATSTAKTKLHLGKSASTAAATARPARAALTGSNPGPSGALPVPWQAGSWPGRNSSGRHSLGADQQTPQQQLRLSADNRPRRDQDLLLDHHSSPGLSPRSSFSGPQATPPQQQQHSTADASPAQGSQAGGAQSAQQQALLPVDVLLSPLLPSADEAKLVDRLSQLRHALDEHVRLAAGWEQQVGRSLSIQSLAEPRCAGLKN